MPSVVRLSVPIEELPDVRFRGLSDADCDLASLWIGEDRPLSAELHEPGFVASAVKEWKRMAPLHRWLVDTMQRLVGPLRIKMIGADDMMTRMRTTIRIDDELLRRLKLKAAETGRTVGSLIEDAVRVALEDAEPDAEPLPSLPTFGAGGVLPGIDLTSTTSLLDAMDADTALDALR